MRLYYKAAGLDGKVVHGIIEAKDQTEVAFYLRKQNLTPVKIILQKESTLAASIPMLKKSPKGKLVFFTRQLSTMLSSGLTLMQSLNILKGQMHNAAMTKIIESVVADVQDGKAFSTAIEKYPEVFGPIYVSLIKAAESAGVLDKVLLRLADNLEKDAKLKAKIKSAMIYPILVIITMIIVVFVMMIFVVPQLAVLYDSFDIELPLATKIVIGMSDFTVKFWYLMIFGAFGTLYSIRRFHKTPTGKFMVDKALLKIPIIGKLLIQSTLVEFTRTLGFLISTGSLVVDSLTKSADTVSNRVYQAAVVAMTKRVEKGIAVGDSMAVDPIFPPILVEMVRVGEQTGKLDESLTRVSEYFESEVEQTVKTLTTAMEPLIMVILAVGVGFLVISIITPIYNLMSAF